MPIYEPGLKEIVQRNVERRRLGFSTAIADGVRFGTFQIIAVGTPPDDSGAADVQQVLGVAESIGAHATDDKIVVVKSTVPVGTSDEVRASIERGCARASSCSSMRAASSTTTRPT
jgi:UDPglucose 6-dehydrogenase